MRTIERPTTIKGMDPAIDATIVMHRGLLDELYKIVSHGSMTNRDKLALVHELSRPEYLADPRAAVVPLRALAKDQFNSLTASFYMRASDCFEEVA